MVIEPREIARVLRLGELALFSGGVVQDDMSIAQQHERAVGSRRWTESERARDWRRHTTREIVNHRLHRVSGFIERRDLRSKHELPIRKERRLIVVAGMLRDVQQIRNGEAPARHVQRSHPNLGIINLRMESRSRSG